MVRVAVWWLEWRSGGYSGGLVVRVAVWWLEWRSGG